MLATELSESLRRRSLLWRDKRAKLICLEMRAGETDSVVALVALVGRVW
jgi:hypothetical protein